MVVLRTVVTVHSTVHSTAHTGHNLGAEIPPQCRIMTWPRVTALQVTPDSREQLIILTHGSAHSNTGRTNMRGGNTLIMKQISGILTQLFLLI